MCSTDRGRGVLCVVVCPAWGAQATSSRASAFFSRENDLDPSLHPEIYPDFNAQTGAFLRRYNLAFVPAGDADHFAVY